MILNHFFFSFTIAVSDSKRLSITRVFTAKYDYVDVHGLVSQIDRTANRSLVAGTVSVFKIFSENVPGIFNFASCPRFSKFRPSYFFC